MAAVTEEAAWETSDLCRILQVMLKIKLEASMSGIHSRKLRMERKMRDAWHIFRCDCPRTENSCAIGLKSSAIGIKQGRTRRMAHAVAE